MEKMKWNFVSGAKFASELRKMGGTAVFPAVPKSAEGFKWNGKNLMFTVKGFEYEYSNIGVYRFRDIKFGPWTIWKAM